MLHPPKRVRTQASGRSPSPVKGVREPEKEIPATKYGMILSTVLIIILLILVGMKILRSSLVLSVKILFITIVLNLVTLVSR